MQTHVFVSRTRKLAGLETPDQARQAIAATLNTLAERLPAEEAKHLAAQLPAELKADLAGAKPFNEVDKFGIDEFYARVGRRLQATPERAQKMAAAVTQVLTEAVSAGEIADVRHMLPAELKPVIPS